MRGWLLLLIPMIATAAEPARAIKVDARDPSRTDFANADRPSYQLKPGEFPPLNSLHQVEGTLVEADFIHRSGTIRTDGTGELIPFQMPPFGFIRYLNADADLRDIPLGTYFEFGLIQDQHRSWNQLVSMQDEFSLLARAGLRYRIEQTKLTEGKLVVRKERSTGDRNEFGRTELLVDDQTRVWKGDRQVPIRTLAADDIVLINSTGSTGGKSRTGERSRRCTDIWIGAESSTRATANQRSRHTTFLKERGIPAWVDQADDETMTVTLFSSDPESLQTLFREQRIDPTLWADEHCMISVAVANEHLRTYRPTVLNRPCRIQKSEIAPSGCYGCGGIRWVLKPPVMLEGYRPGRNLRLFVHPDWPVADMPFGEGLAAGGHDEEPADARELQSAEFPYRTDFGNENLPWYSLQPGQFPPDHSGHRVVGELVKVNADGRSGQFRMEGTRQLVQFTMPPFGSVQHLNADANLDDLPLGLRCVFLLYQDQQGDFTVAGVVRDEYSDLATNTLTYRVESIELEPARVGQGPSNGRLIVIRHAAPVKVDYVLEPRVPCDFGRLELLVDERTRVWKDDRSITLRDLKVGDELLVNRAAHTASDRGRCTEIWVGKETHERATEQQRARYQDSIRERGLPGWIDSVENNQITLTFFAGQREPFLKCLGDTPWGKNVLVKRDDARTNPSAAGIETMVFQDHLPEGNTTGCYGCSGIRWRLSTSERLSPGYAKGQTVRVVNPAWPVSESTRP